MTREEAKRLLPIIKAYAEGKAIQLKCDGDGEWEDLKGDFLAILAPSAYRIKPEAKCRPFKSAEECWQEMQRHQPFGWVKEDGHPCSIIGLNDNGCNHGGYDPEGEGYNYPTLFKFFTFIDGHPFGIKEGEG